MYGAQAAVAWCRYGRVRRAAAGREDALLDHFMPEYEVVERHQIRIAAPVTRTFEAARELDLGQSAVVRAIFRGRQLLIGDKAKKAFPQGALLIQMRAMGWGLLAEMPGREIVMGAVTKPWEANVTFRSLPPREFATFCEPGYVKIAWTLRADPIGVAESIASTETRVATTDAYARAKFRRYWALFSPGIVLIRRVALRAVKAAAERPANNTRNRGAPVSAAPVLKG